MIRALIVLSILALPGLALGQAEPSPHDPARLFPREAEVRVGGHTGLVRVPLTAEVLAEVRPDLSDVRLHRADGREAPYVVDSGARPSARPVRYEATPIAVERRLERGDSLRPSSFERFEVIPPGEVRDGERWVLDVGTSREDFVRAVTVRGEDGAVIARATVFRLPSPLRERTRVELPPLPGSERLSIELVGEGGYLEPTLTFATTYVPLAPALVTVALEERARRVEGGRTILELVRPRGLSPDRLRISTETGHFARPVRVLDVTAGRAPRPVGDGLAFRVRDLAAPLEELELDLGATRGETLRIEIDDGDSGPLEALAFVAVVRQPVLLFEATGEDVSLRFGGGRARAPRYDLGHLLRGWVGEALLERRLPAAELGPIRANPAFDEGPALAFAMRPGRAVDLAGFTHVAPLVVEGAREGASHVRLPPAVQARARDDLGDVRIVDAGGNQWPYLVASAPLPDRVRATLDAPASVRGGHTSAYALRAPDGRARVERVVLHADAPYVARAYRLIGVDADGVERELARGELTREPRDPSPLEIAFAARWVERLELRIDDGSDAPIRFERAELDLVSPTLFLAAPDGDYRLLVGDPEAAPPAYEIARAAELVLSVRAAEARVGEAAPNPAHVEPPWYAAADAQSLALWAVLILAVLVLGVLTFRLAGRGPEEPDAPEEDGDAEASAEPPDGAPPGGASTSRDGPVRF